MLMSLLGYLGHACVFEVEVNLALKTLVLLTKFLDVKVRLIKESGESVTVSDQLSFFIAAGC